MKNAGYGLITLGFLGGALASVVTETGVPWGYFGAALVVGVVGDQVGGHISFSCG